VLCINSNECHVFVQQGLILQTTALLNENTTLAAKQEVSFRACRMLQKAGTPVLTCSKISFPTKARNLSDALPTD
jgi:hypothetical protein